VLDQLVSKMRKYFDSWHRQPNNSPFYQWLLREIRNSIRILSYTQSCSSPVGRMSSYAASWLLGESQFQLSHSVYDKLEIKFTLPHL
jgi:hypothetical protein